MYGSLVDADSSDYVRKEIWAVPQPKDAYEWRAFLFSHLDKPVPLNWNSNSQHQRKNKWRR